MNTRHRQLWTWVAVGLVMLALTAYALRPQSVAVDFAAVERGLLRVTLNEEGSTRVKEVYVISAPVVSTVTRIESHVGDPVNVGDVLAVLRPTDPTFLDKRTRMEAEAAIKAAQAALALAGAETERARAELAFARAERKRSEILAARGDVSQRDLDLKRLNVDRGEAALAVAKATGRMKSFELENARAALIAPGGDGNSDRNNDSACCVDVRSPVKGYILRIHQESEAVIAVGTPLVEIGDPADLEIVVDLLSTDAVRVREGAAVDIVEWGGAPLTGTVRRIEPYGFTKTSALGIEEQRVNVIVDFNRPAAEWRQLGHGFRIKAHIETWRDADVLKVPVAALFRIQSDWAVFVSTEGKARQRIIDVGHMNGVEAEVLSGLTEGELVILHPSDRVSDGEYVVSRNVK